MEKLYHFTQFDQFAGAIAKKFTRDFLKLMLGVCIDAFSMHVLADLGERESNVIRLSAGCDRLQQTERSLFSMIVIVDDLRSGDPVESPAAVAAFDHLTMSIPIFHHETTHAALLDQPFDQLTALSQCIQLAYNDEQSVENSD
jgi:hypothetical protein